MYGKVNIIVLIATAPQHPKVLIPCSDFGHRYLPFLSFTHWRLTFVFQRLWQQR